MKLDREHWEKMLPFIHAFVDGKDVISYGLKRECPNFDGCPSAYTIVDPPPRYRPWTVDEVPLGKEVRNKETGLRSLLVYTGKTYSEHYLSAYTMADGSPCGVKVEDEI